MHLAVEPLRAIGDDQSRGRDISTGPSSYKGSSSYRGQDLKIEPNGRSQSYKIHLSSQHVLLGNCGESLPERPTRGLQEMGKR